MNTEQLRRKARELYNNKEVPQEVNQYNQRKWIRSVLKLGDKWLLNKPQKVSAVMTFTAAY